MPLIAASCPRPTRLTALSEIPQFCSASAVTVVFAALAITRHLTAATGLTVRNILHALKPMQQITVRIAGHDHVARDPITKPAQAILDALNTTLD